MTTVEILTLVCSLVSLVIAAVSLIRTRKVAVEQLRLDRITADLAQKQLEQIEQQEGMNKLPSLTVTMGKLGKKWNLVIANRGTGSARNLDFELIDCHDNPFFNAGSKLPHPDLRAGQRIKLGAAIHMQSPSKYHLRITYNDLDGGSHSEDHHVTL